MALLRGLIVLLVLYHAVTVPVQPRKKPNEETQLKKELGEEDYQKFRQYMNSEKVEQMKKFVHMKPEEREKFLKELNEEFERRRHHETVHEPGSVPQLKEVWHKEHNMTTSYSPQLLFKMHDLNNDQFLDEHEIAALIEHEIEKIYPVSSGEIEMRQLEAKRMQEYLFNQTDHNHDRMLSLNEFLSPKPDDDGDDEWMPLQDLEELPDFEKKTDDKELLNYAQKQMELHPDDEEMEEVMHMLHGVKGIPDPSRNPPDAAKSYMNVNPPSGGGALHPPATPAPPAGQQKVVQTHL